MKKLTFRKILSFSTDIITKLPTSRDNWLIKAVKVVAVLDSFDRFLGSKNHKNPFNYLRAMDAEQHTNRQFVQLFFETKLKNAFDVSHIELNDYVDVIEAHNEKHGDLYFIEWHWGKPEVSQDFWSSKGFKFNDMLMLLWQQYGNKIDVGVKKNRNDEIEITYDSISAIDYPMFGQAKEKIAQIIDCHIKYVKDNVPRTYLFYGMQGIGKSTMALKFADEFGGRVLRIDSCGLTSMNMHDLVMILDGMSPDFLIFDDLDRAANLQDVLPTLFSMLTEMKTKYPKITIIITVNSLSAFNSAFLRPGRIDEIIEFNPPEEDDRKAILNKYVDKFNLDVSGVIINELSEKSKGLTAAYLREIILQTKYKDIDAVYRIVDKQVELICKEGNKNKKSEKKESAESNVPITSAVTS